MSESRRRPSTFSICLAIAAVSSAACYANIGWEAVALAAFICLVLIAIAGTAILPFGIHAISALIEHSNRDERRLFQFSLKQLLAFVFVIALASGAIGLRWRAIAVIAEVGGDWNEDKVFLSRTRVSDDDLEHRGWMGRVEVVWLCNTNIGDDGLRRLGRLAGVRSLFIDGTEITDAGLVHLQGLPLRWLGLNGTAITDAGIPHLARLTSLERLDVRGVAFSDEGQSRLAAALPHCQISR